ncbi:MULTISPECIES: hypothetical protein [unclassified Photorhabdus]|uniref:hypothetical protein n=1 Tax=unclassified Photorhabdus TaxID=2620880 RepID=UPI000DCF6162|nr:MULTISPECIES: hypothetical protein [unclassified Photorhabdus]RAW93952.1 hypothetical protein CKY03_21255 [Photorhabdus sp. S9-53]RAW94044.1 hypothetical protein CKY05_21175 [Photorhabdus sp. S10-54]RAW97510.1 hypothetical protein CKY04_21155 [Photorhabdus sp. S8-52]
MKLLISRLLRAAFAFGVLYFFLLLFGFFKEEPINNNSIEYKKEKWSHSFKMDKTDRFHIETATTDNGIATLQLQRYAGILSMYLQIPSGRFVCRDDCIVRIKLNGRPASEYIALSTRDPKIINVRLKRIDIEGIKLSKNVHIEAEVSNYGWNYNGEKMFSFDVSGNPFVGKVSININEIRKMVDSGKKPEMLSADDGSKKIESFEACKKIFYKFHNNENYVSVIEREEKNFIVGVIYSSIDGAVLNCSKKDNSMTMLEYM